MQVSGETVTIARHDKPVADLVKTRDAGFPLGIAKGDDLVPPGDDWWAQLTDDEAEAWAEGR